MKNSFSIIVPAYKEEQSIRNVIIGILDVFKKKNLEFEILIIVDKDPNDKTFDIAVELTKEFNEIRLFSREKRHGVASAIQEGIQQSSNDVIVIAMADESEDPKDLVTLALKMNEGYDMVFGNRFTHRTKIQGYSQKKYFVNRLCNFAIRVLFGINSSDITNAVKAYRASLLKSMKIKSSGFEIFAELPIRVYLANHKNFTEIPTNHYVNYKSNSKFSISSEGPKYLKIILNCFFNK